MHTQHRSHAMEWSKTLSILPILTQIQYVVNAIDIASNYIFQGVAQFSNSMAGSGFRILGV